MTALSLTLQNVATRPYSAERLARMDRANRITRLMFNARRKGMKLTAAEAGEICDAEIDQPNIPTKTPISKPAATPVLAFIVEANQPAANDSTVATGVIAQVITKARQIVSQGLRTLSDWINAEVGK